MFIFLVIIALILMMLSFLCASAQKWFDDRDARNRPPEFRTPPRPTRPHSQTRAEAPESPHERHRRLEQQRRQEIQRQETQRQQADRVDLVASMTPAERRRYVANFLKTDKFADASEPETRPRSGSFVLSQSMRKFAGLSSSNLSVRSNMSDDSSQYCAICLEQFTNGEDICVSQNDECSHKFHLVCAFGWLLKSQECPCCRRDYLSVGSVNKRSEEIPQPTNASRPSAPEESVPQEEDASSHHGLTAQEILDRVASELPPLPSNPPPHQGLTAQALLAGAVPRDDGPIFHHRGLTARQILEGEIPVEVLADRASPHGAATYEQQADVPAPSRWGTQGRPFTSTRRHARPPSRELVVVIDHQRVAQELIAGERTPAYTRTARQMLSGQVPSSSEPSVFRHEGLTARQMLSGQRGVEPGERTPQGLTAREMLA